MSNHNEKVFFKPYLFVLSVVIGFLVLISWMIISNSQKEAEVVAAPTTSKSQTSDQVSSAIDEITAPVGKVSVDEAAGSEGAASPAAEDSVGKTTYDGVCFACHGAGVAGAPKYGDKDAWTARLEQGNDTLYDHTIKGFTGKDGMMPAKGGRVDIADDDVKAAVDYMLEAVGGAPAEPVAEIAAVVEEEVVPASAQVVSGKGKEIYDGACMACHALGIAGAPKHGDKEAWVDRLGQGNDTLYDHAINGFTGASGSMMPAKGGRADFSDDDVKAAVDYMLEAVGGAVASVAVEDAAPAVVATTDGKGKEVYDGACFVCHTTGVAGAPKLGDKEDWTARAAQGNDTLYDHAIKGFMGKGMMPPKGGKANLSDDDVKAAVDYMVGS